MTHDCPYRITLSKARKWTDQAAIGQTMIFQEGPTGELVQVWAIGDTYDDAIANLDAADGEWQDVTDRMVVADVDTLETLTAEYAVWNRDNGLALGSADEHLIDDDLTHHQRAYLTDFVRRWTAAATRESTAQ